MGDNALRPTNSAREPEFGKASSGENGLKLLLICLNQSFATTSSGVPDAIGRLLFLPD